MREHDDGDLFRPVAGRCQPLPELAHAGFPRTLAQPGIEKHQFRTGVDERRREAVDETIGGQEVFFHQFRDRLRTLVLPENGMRPVARPQAVAYGGDLETADPEAVDIRQNGPGHLRLGKGGTHHDLRRSDNTGSAREAHLEQRSAISGGHHFGVPCHDFGLDERNSAVCQRK